MGFLQISLSLHTWVAAETHLADDKNNNNNNINNNNKWQYKRGHHQGQGYKVKSLTHNPKDEGSIFLLNIRKQSHSATIEKGLVPQYKNRFLTNVFQICVICSISALVMNTETHFLMQKVQCKLQSHCLYVCLL